MQFSPNTVNELKNIKKFEQFATEVESKISRKRKIIEINGNLYDDNWYCNVDNECHFKVKFYINEVAGDDQLNNLILKNSAKFLPNLHFINIKNPRLFKIE
jgi:uncharacterized protein YxjI